jgi:hypothetical protein
MWGKTYVIRWLSTFRRGQINAQQWAFAFGANP